MLKEIDICILSNSTEHDRKFEMTIFIMYWNQPDLRFAPEIIIEVFDAVML